MRSRRSSLRHTTKDEPIEPRVHPASVAIGAEAPTAPPARSAATSCTARSHRGVWRPSISGDSSGRPASPVRSPSNDYALNMQASPTSWRCFSTRRVSPLVSAHPNVVPTLDVVDTDGEVFLVMEYVRGATLSHLVRCAKSARGTLSGPHLGGHRQRDPSGPSRRARSHERSRRPSRARPSRYLAAERPHRLRWRHALARLRHRQGFRPLADHAGRHAQGKLSYMAPEQVRNEAISPRTDLYAAAVILWELLTGKRLFHADSEVGTITRVLSAPVVRPIAIVPDLPPALDRLVVRGLERDPSKRFASAREMAAELSACLAVPSTVDIGEWVERTVGHDLRERAARVAAIERAAAEAVDPASGRDVVSGVKVSKRAAHAIARRDVIADAADHATQAEGKARSSLICSTDPGLSTDATASRTRKWMAVGSVSVALVIASAVGLSSLSRPRPNSRNIDEARDGVRGAVVAIAPSPPGSVAPPPAAALERPAEKPLVAPSSNSTGVATVAKRAHHREPGADGSSAFRSNSNVARRRRLHSALYDGRKRSRPLQAELHEPSRGGSFGLRSDCVRDGENLHRAGNGRPRRKGAMSRGRRSGADPARRWQIPRGEESFVVCSRDVCPNIVAQSCMRWLREVDEDAPTVVAGAKDEQGVDLTDVHVFFDGRTLHEPARRSPSSGRRGRACVSL